MVCDFLDMVSIETMTFKDGYVYAVVQPNSLKNIQNAHEKSLPTFSPELLNVINPHKERLDSKNNFFILRMKPKNKLTYCNLKKQYMRARELYFFLLLLIAVIVNGSCQSNDLKNQLENFSGSKIVFPYDK